MKPRNPEISVCFILSGKNVDLNEITTRLNIATSLTRTLDDWPDAIKNPKIKLPDELKPRYDWEFGIEYENNLIVKDRFNVLLEFLKGKECIINELKKQFSLETTFWLASMHATTNVIC